MWRSAAQVARDEAEARHHSEQQDALDAFEARELAREGEVEVDGEDEEHKQTLHVVEEGLARKRRAQQGIAQQGIPAGSRRGHPI